MLEKINHYSLTNLPSIHDEEALTALELAGRTAAKTNETVVAFNTLEKETGEHLKTQDDSIEKMNTVTMPAKVKAEMQARIDDGTFDEKIDASLGGLNARVNNLLGSLNEGSTTMDAEIVDARTSVDGYAMGVLGDAQRAVEKLCRLGASINDFTVENMTGTMENGYYMHRTGEHIKNDAYRCLTVDVEPYDVIFIMSYYGWDVADAIVYDADGAMIGPYHTKNAGASNQFQKPLIIPSNGAKLKVQSYIGESDIYQPQAKRVVSLHFDGKKACESNQKILDLLKNYTPVLGEPVSGNVTVSAIMRSPHTIKTLDDYSDQYQAGEFDVTPGDVLYVYGSANYTNYVYSFADGVRVISSVKADTRVKVDGCVIVPPGANKLRIACEDKTAPIVKHVTGLAFNTGKGWGHLKWVCLGDSLTEVNNRTTKHYHSYIQDKTGINVVNMGVSGSGYMNPADGEKAFYQRALNIPADADVITIFGSGNDMGYMANLGTPADTGTDTLCGCINKTIDNIYSVNPTVQLGIVSPTPWKDNTPDKADGTMTQYSNALKAICERRGIPFLDLFRQSGYRVNDGEFRSLAFSKDPEGEAVHPDETGHKIISSRFMAFLESLIGTY